VPIGVVIPRGADARRDGGGVSSPRRADPVARRRDEPRRPCCTAAVVMDMSKYFNRVLDIDPRRRVARVEPGIVLDARRILDS